MILWLICYLKYRPKKNLADVFFRHRPEQMCGRCVIYIALRYHTVIVFLINIQLYQKQGGMC
jgi:hypothetical protein